MTVGGPFERGRRRGVNSCRETSNLADNTTTCKDKESFEERNLSAQVWASIKREGQERRSL